MKQQIKTLKNRFKEVADQLQKEGLAVGSKEYIALSKEYKKLSDRIEMADEYERTGREIEELKALLEKEQDAEMKLLARQELIALEAKSQEEEERLKIMLLPQDPHEEKNCMLEIRGGAGGDEAAIWAGDLFRMYQRFAEKKRWKIEVLDFNEGTSGGYKEIIAKVSGARAYVLLKYESGVHRVQRIPATETQGRIHTSTASIAVLPEADEVDVKVDMNEVKKETFCASGPGGQSVNTTYSAVRLTHIPTGITASCQDGKSQIKNFEKALQVLRTRLYEKKIAEQKAELGAERKAMVGTGDRSEKIRTYNYPQGRITDHRIGYTQHNLPAVLNGEIAPLIEKLRLADQTAMLEAAQS